MSILQQVPAAIPAAAYNASFSRPLGTLPGENTELLVYLNVTAVSGTTPSLTVTYQTSPDGVTFYDHTASAAITAVGNYLIKVPQVIGKYGNLNSVISGTTPSFTFSAVAEGKRP